jgi:hypothetical protein
MNGDQLWRGTSYMDGSPKLVRGPGQITFRPFTRLVEPQEVTLGFATLPKPGEARDIEQDLRAMLDRALA